MAFLERIKAIIDALPAGNNNIGDVDIASMPALPAGTNNIGDVDVLSLPALPAGANNIGDVDVLSLPALPAGSNNIGDVDIASMPALPAGTNNIGDVDVLTMPAITGTVTANAGTNLNTSLLGLESTQAAIKTAVELIDDPVVTLGTSTYVEGTTKAVVLAGVRRDADTTLVDTTNEAAPLQVNAGGQLKVAVVAALPAGNNNVGDVDIVTMPNVTLAASSNNIGDVDVLTLPALPAGNNNIGDVDVATMPNVTLAAGTNTNEVVGDVAEDVALAGNPVRLGFRASTAQPAAMSADGRVVTPWATLNGAQVHANLPHVGLNANPFTLTGKTAQYTSAQTGIALVTPTSGKKLVVTAYQIQVGGTVAGTVQLWFGASADTTYSRGADLAIFDGEFAPSATQKPGVAQTGLWIAGAADHILRVTDSAAINPLTVTVWYYEV